MKVVTGIIASFVLVGSFVLPPPVLAGDVLNRIMKTRTLTVATDAGYPPQSYQTDDGSFDGFDIDVGTEIARRLGVEMTVVTPAWQALIAGGWSDRWDIAITSMIPTRERAKVLDFPAIYYYRPASFAVHKDNTTFESIKDLNGKRIGVCRGCSYELYLDRTLVISAEGAPLIEFIVKKGKKRTYETDTDAFDDLRLGDGVRLDAVLSALPEIRRAIEVGYPMKVIGDPVFFEPLSVAIDKGDAEFAAKLTEIVDGMHADETLTRLSTKWYGVDLTTTKPAS